MKSTTLLLTALLVLASGSARPAAPDPPLALITGADRGIGLALTEELAGRGWAVVATGRDPAHAQLLRDFAVTHPRVFLEALDVTDGPSVDALAAHYRGRAIDALVNNAGILGDLTAQQALQLGADDFQKVMQVNAYGPLRVARAFIEQVTASRQKKIVAISSGLGSTWSAPWARGAAAYSMSKAALNMGMRLLQSEVQDRGILVGIVSPGPVDTDMQQHLRAAAAAAGRPITAPTLTPTESAHALADYIEALGPDKAGRFYSYTGQEIPW